MDYRMVTILVGASANLPPDEQPEDTEVVPAAALEIPYPYVSIGLWTSASDPNPKMYALRRTEDGQGLVLLEAGPDMMRFATRDKD